MHYNELYNVQMKSETWRPGLLEGRLSLIEARLGARLDSLEVRLSSLESRFNIALRIFRSSQELLVDLLAYEGLMRREAYVLARSETQRLFTEPWSSTG
jgi:hypothetical protein